VSIASDLIKALPHDEFAERAILGAMLIDNKYVNQVFSKIGSRDFYRDSHQLISGAISTIVESSKSADPITVSGYLEKKKELKFAGGYEYLNSLMDGIPENINIEEYIEIVKERSALRGIIVASLGVIQKGVDQTADVQSILNELQEDIIKISDARDKEGFHSSSELIPQALEMVENIQKHGESGGLKTGYYELDNMTSGFQKGDLIVLAARPSMGKTALALNIAARMALKEEKSVGFFSLEMSSLQIMMRLLSLTANISMSAIRTGKPRFNQQEWGRLDLDAGALGKAKLYIDDTASLSIIEMKTRARRLMNEHSLDIIFVDYLQLPL